MCSVTQWYCLLLVLSLVLWTLITIWRSCDANVHYGRPGLGWAGVARYLDIWVGRCLHWPGHSGASEPRWLSRVVLFLRCSLHCKLQLYINLLSWRRVLQGLQAWTIACDSLLEDQAWATHDEQSVTWHHFQFQQTQQPDPPTYFLNSIIKYPSESGWEN